MKKEPHRMFRCGSEDPCRFQDRVGRTLCGNCADLHLTQEEIKRRAFITAELEKFNDPTDPWWKGLTEWNGVDGGMFPDGTIGRHIT